MDILELGPLFVCGNSLLTAAGAPGVGVVEVEVVLVVFVVDIEAESTPSGSESEQVSQVQSLPSSSEFTELCLLTKSWNQVVSFYNPFESGSQLYLVS